VDRRDAGADFSFQARPGKKRAEAGRPGSVRNSPPLEISSRRDVQSARHLAAIAAKRKNWEVAIKWFEAALALTPEDGANWYNLGYVCEHAGKPREAIAAFTEAVRLTPEQDMAWYGMGLAHARLGQHDEAVKALEKVVALQPMSGEGFYQLGMAYHHANRPDDVTTIVERLVGFEPKRARKLVKDTARADLMKLIPELPF
jgi:tetratricopeptide (TPR) repeat protein